MSFSQKVIFDLWNSSVDAAYWFSLELCEEFGTGLLQRTGVWTDGW